MINYNKIKSILQNPLVILGSVLLGLWAGFSYPQLGTDLGSYGTIYMALFEMSIIPIILSSIALSISKLLTFQHKDRYLKRILLVLMGIMLLVSLLGALSSMVLKPEETILATHNEDLKKISLAASSIDRTMTSPIEENVEKGFIKFLLGAVPNNIFAALAQSQNFQILVFSLILGIAIAYLTETQREKAENFLSVTLTIFQKIIMSITVWLPIAVFCLIAGTSSTVGIDKFTQMGVFIFKAYMAFFAVFVVGVIIIKLKTKETFLNVLSYLKTPIFMAFGTRSAIATVPSMIETFENNFKLDKNITSFFISLGSIIGRFGNIIYFSFTSIFIAGIYRIPLTFSHFVIITTLSVLAGLSTTGATGILTLSMITIVLDPLNLPVGAIMPLLIAVDTMIDPMRTLLSVFMNGTALALIAPRQKK